MNRPVTARTLLGLLFILAATFAVYFPSFQYDFTNWDDGIYVTNNSAIHHLDLPSVADLFRPNAKYMYHPLTMVTYALDWFIGAGSAESFHMTSVLFHLLNVILVFFLLRYFISSETVVLFCVAVFALHPLQVESVVWISARKEILYSFFYLISLLFYCAWDRRDNIYFYFLSFIFFIFSLLSKPTAVTLPLVILAGEWIRAGKLNLKTIARLTPFIIGTAALTILNTSLQYTAAPIQNYSILQRALLIADELFFYLSKFALPRMLSACYAYPALVNNLLPLEYCLAPLYLALGIAALWLVRKMADGIFLGPLMFLLTLLPVLQLIPFNNASLVADRYVYLPVIGLAFLIAELAELGAAELSKHSIQTRNMKSGAFILIILFFMVASIQRMPVWENALTLFDDVIQKNDQIGIAYGNRAETKTKRGDYRGALADCEQLVTFRPDDGQAYHERGSVLLALHKERAAVTDLTRAIDLGFAKSTTYYNRGIAYSNLGACDSALADFNSSRLLDSAFADAPYSIGYLTLHSLADARGAVAYFDTAVAINPKYAEALYQRAIAEYHLRAYGKAMEDISAAISNHPELRNDPLVPEINRSIDSTNAAVAELQKLADKSPATRDEIFRLRELYLMLGDSLRANANSGPLQTPTAMGTRR